MRRRAWILALLPWVTRRGLCIALVCCLPALAAEKTAYDFRYWDWGQTPKRDDYQFAVLETALSLTQKQFGPYTATRVKVAYGTARARREINRGETINIRGGPWISARDISAAGMELNEAINLPIMNNLLGYRALIVRQAELYKYQHLKTLGDLRKLVLGQGRGWQDVEIYRANGFTVNDRAGPNNIIAMLIGKRFDALPMGIIETDAILDKAGSFQDQLAVLHSVNIYYPFPIVFYTNIHRPELAKRLKEGLKKAQQNGALEALFERFFHDEIALIHRKNSRFFVLKNPFLPPELVIPEPLLRLNNAP